MVEWDTHFLSNLRSTNKLNSNKTTYVLLGISAICALWTILQTSIIYLESADWGLLYRLPLTYWVGIALFVVALLLKVWSVSLNTRISILILIFVYLYVAFIPVVILQPVGFSANSLWPASESNLLMETGHISIGNPRSLMSYESWPFFTIFTATLRSITGAPLILLSKWFPLFAIALWSFSSFLLIRRFVGPEYALIGAALVICGSWTRQQYFGPQSYVFVFYLLFIILFISLEHMTSDKKRFFGIMFMMFLAVLFSHALTTFVVLIAIILFYAKDIFSAVFKKSVSVSQLRYEILSFFLFIGAFLMYIIYISPQFLSAAFDSILTVLTDVGELRQIHEFERLPGSLFQQLTNASVYVIIASFLCISCLTLFYIMRKRMPMQRKPAFLILLLFALLIIAAMPYGAEGPLRAFLFGLPIFSLFTVCLLQKKPLILGCFFLVILIAGIPALYGSDSYRLATGPELAGNQYSAQYLPSEVKFFYKFSPYIRYYSPPAKLFFEVIGKPPFTSYDPVAIKQNLNSTDFIVISRNQRLYYEYYLGLNPFETVDIDNDFSVSSARLYDNGNFTLYTSISYER